MSDPNRMAIEAIREHYGEAVARAELMDQLRAVAVERANNECNRAEAAEAELRELRKLVDAWKAADEDRANHKESRCGEELLQRLLEEAEEALRHA